MLNQSPEIPSLPENNFWLRIWQSALALIAVLIICITAYNISTTAMLIGAGEELVRSGRDPISVRCMTANYNDAICLAYAAGRK